MKVCVLSGSPKGTNSITYQTVLYLQKQFPDCEFDCLHVGQRIRSYEKDMTEAVASVQQADLVLFVYPVYTFIVPYQLHRFIELLKEQNIDFTGKFAAQITTSKHFYDTTAHRFIEENCSDLGLAYIGGLSQDMEDLLQKKGRKEAADFWKFLQFQMKAAGTGAQTETGVQTETNDRVGTSTQAGTTVIVANLEPDDTALAGMIADFQAIYKRPTKLVNIAEYPFTGGCLGCMNCAVTGKCIYKDGFDEFLRNEIQSGESIVYAFTIKDHSMGSKMKLYDDRQFCNGHRTVTMGMPMGYLVNGNLDNEPNLRMIMEGRAQVGGNYLAGIAQDKRGIESLARVLDYALETKLSQPAMFLGVGGSKIFRDLIWLMQGIMRADHKFYKEHGFYDFPQKKRGTMITMKLLGLLINNPKVQAKMGNKMTEGMLMPYKKVLEDEKSQ